MSPIYSGMIQKSPIQRKRLGREGEIGREGGGERGGGTDVGGMEGYWNYWYFEGNPSASLKLFQN